RPNFWGFTGRIPLKVFEPRQKGLAARFGGDDVHDLPRVMRVPGFIHKKAAPFLSHVVAINRTELPRASILLKTFRPAKKKKDPPPPPPPRNHDLSEQWK